MRTILYLLFFVFGSIIRSEIIYVPDDYSTIQGGINASNHGDSIFVDPGFYPESIDFNGKAIVVSSRYIIENDSLLIGLTIIDAQENESVVTFDSEETNSSILQGFTIQNGTGNDEDPDENGSYYTYGGGVYCESSDPVIRDCIIKDNLANEGGGGGIFCYNASPVFYGCTIFGNETDDVGGGLYARSGSSPEFYSCTFYDNTAEFGGGCYLRHESTPIMDNVTFRENSANNSGGGISLKDDANLQADHLFIINNIAEGLGGGFYVNNANPELSFSLIADNLSSSGAGAYIRSTSVVNFTNVTIANNVAGLYGNGIYMRDEVQVDLLNTVLWNNGSIQVYFRSEGTEVELTIDYSLVENGEEGIDSNDNGDVIWGTGNLDEEPYFCNSSAGNYYIRENSPCVDGGAGGSLMGCFESGCGPINVGPVWYVDLNGDNDNDGSLEAPFETIARAMTVAANGDTIRLNPGVYTEAVDFDNKEIVLESRAFETDNFDLISETYFGPGPVGGTCLTLNGSTNDHGVIRGISFRGGSYPYGGGIVITNCSPTLMDVIVKDNTAEIGGGIYISESDAVLMNMTIQNNGANLGGGIYITDGAPLLENVMIRDNIAYWGGGLYFENAEPTIRHSVIRENEAFIEGAGLYQNGGIGTIKWTAFEHNNGYDYGGGIVANQATIDLDQTTFTGNISGIGSAMTLHSSAVTIENSILWDNLGSLFYSPEESGITYLEINYSDMQGGEEIFSEYPTILLTMGSGMINTDPEFCDPENNYFNLKDSSFCQTASDTGGVIGAYDFSCDMVLAKDDYYSAETFMLSQNYPNPFNPSTRIRYSLAEYGNYSLKIYNITGLLIKTLRSEPGQPGQYTVLWDSTNERGEKVTSGVYFYQLSTQSNFTSNKMILMK